jgi:hypothetical protein
MPGEPLYKKYGVNTPNPLNTLTKSQQAVGSSLQDAMNSVKDLLNTQEQKYKDENTLNMQAYLQDRIKEQGLGADPIDEVAIKQQFGKRINMDDLTKTFTQQMTQLKDDAVNKATQLGVTAFDNTKDMPTAGKVVRDNLLSAGMKPTDVDKVEADFREKNKFRAEDVAHEKALRKSQFSGKVLEAITSGLDENQIMGMVEELPLEDRAEAVKTVRDQFELKSKLSPDKLAEYQYGVETSANKRDELLALQEENIAQAKNSYDAINVVPETAVAAARDYNSKLGGFAKAVDTATDAAWYKDVANFILHPFNGKIKNDNVAGLHVENKIKELINTKKIDPETATAIAYQAVNDVYESGSTPKAGQGLDSTAFDDKVQVYLDRYNTKQDALDAYNKAREKAIQNKLKISAAHNKYVYTNKRKFRRQQRMNEKLHITQDMQKGLEALYNIKDAAKVTNGVKPPPALTPPDPKKDSVTTVDDIIGRADQNKTENKKYSHDQSGDRFHIVRSPKYKADTKFVVGGLNDEYYKQEKRIKNMSKSEQTKYIKDLLGKNKISKPVANALLENIVKSSVTAAKRKSRPES